MKLRELARKLVINYKTKDRLIYPVTSSQLIVEDGFVYGIRGKELSTRARMQQLIEQAERDMELEQRR